jgi:zinc transporter ZupT
MMHGPQNVKFRTSYYPTIQDGGGRVLVEVLDLYVRIKIRVATFDTNHSVTDSTQLFAASIQTEASSFCGQVSQHSSP